MYKVFNMQFLYLVHLQTNNDVSFIQRLNVVVDSIARVTTCWSSPYIFYKYIIILYQGLFQ